MTSKSEKYLKRIRATVKNSGVKSTHDSDNILKKFTRQFGHLKKLGLEIDGIADLGLDYQVISISTPFIFDNRLIPKTYMGYVVRSGTQETNLPVEFRNIYSEKEYIWSYQRFERFVDSNEDLIRTKLNNPTMTRDEMLDALCFGDFKKHRESCIKSEEEGKIPKWIEK